MHKSSLLRMEWFVRTYLNDSKGQKKILDVGSFNVNGSYRQFFDEQRFLYTGLDMSEGPNVDIVPQNPYIWDEVEDESFDVVISGQAFEHIEFPWITMAEIARVVKRNGLVCILVPRLQGRHRYPVDTYRYDVDGLVALSRYVGLEVLHASMNLAPKNAPKEWISAAHGDAFLIASKPDNWSGLVDLRNYTCVPSDIEALATGFADGETNMKNFQGPFEKSELDSIGIKYGTDKSSKQHDFLRKYQFFLESWKNDDFTCLELGVQNGFSLKMWKDFFPKARVVGVDIDPRIAKKIGDLEYKIGDLGDVNFLSSLQSYEPRLIIDDASHLWSHQINAFFTLFPYLQPGGIYILEDICTSFKPWANKYKDLRTPSKLGENQNEGYNFDTPFHVMETLAECITSQEKTPAGVQLSLLSPPSPYQPLIERVAKTVDCVAFIKFSCIIVKKKVSTF